MEHGHEHQEGQSHGPQEEDDLLYQEPCRDGGANISLCRTQRTPATPRSPRALEPGRSAFRALLYLDGYCEDPMRSCLWQL